MKFFCPMTQHKEMDLTYYLEVTRNIIIFQESFSWDKCLFYQHPFVISKEGRIKLIL